MKATNAYLPGLKKQLSSSEVSCSDSSNVAGKKNFVSALVNAALKCLQSVLDLCVMMASLLASFMSGVADKCPATVLISF